MSELILMLAGGLIAGVIAGMGIGGGAILIPFLCIFAGMDQRTAQCINLLYFIPTGIIAVIRHIKNKKIDKEMVKGMALYGLVSTAAGAFLALAIDQEWLRRLFGVFLLAVGLHELLKKDEGKDNDNARNINRGERNGTA
ncbi:MAG: sulfite exporter TauE/SafE family protein [Clostridiales bacterium]|jgi:uncharacterized membrane protein YfcA|nr:sulfite exporter TauE/SafE family protein [Clostridiales bacterium]